MKTLDASNGLIARNLPAGESIFLSHHDITNRPEVQAICLALYGHCQMGNVSKSDRPGVYNIVMCSLYTEAAGARGFSMVVGLIDTTDPERCKLDTADMLEKIKSYTVVGSD